MSLDATYRALEDAAMDGLGIPKGAKVTAKGQGAKAEDFGLINVGLHSQPEDMADWERRLWHDQDDVVEERAREWVQAIYYDANYQYITYHRDMRRWIPRRTVPWRVRSIYNITHKSVNWRVSRLTENKPQVQVQARSEDREDVERAEYKEMLFWYLWDRLRIHEKIRKGRRWSALCGVGFLKGGWDPTAGEGTPATKFLDETIEIDLPPEEGDRGAAMILGVAKETLTVPTEYYVDAAGNKLGPVYEIEMDEDLTEEERLRDEAEEGEVRSDMSPPKEPLRKRQEPPEGTATLNDGEAYIDVRTPFNLRWERYVDDIADSWYVQDADILPASRILALWPKAIQRLKEATPASDEDKALQWQGVVPRRWQFQYEGTEYGRAQNTDSNETVGYVDREYLVRETWIFPKTDHLKKLWGQSGRVLVTVGGVLVEHYPLPRWAIEACPFVALPEDYEPGNHYYRTFLRDIVPIQDDINRSRSHLAEAGMVAARPMIGALQNNQINMKLLGHMPGVLVTYRSPQHKPEMLQFNPSVQIMRDFYDTSLAAAQDIGNMNEASTGKLPSAGLAAKAIYALQYADERSITEVSNAQDDALNRIAQLLDAITKREYDDERKIRVVGENRFYLAEADILPEHLQAEVDYRFVPGSMLERQKEAVRNEVSQWLEMGLIDQARAAKLLPSAVPGGLRQSHDLHEAKARRQVQMILTGKEGSDPQPWDNPAVHVMVIEETMLAAKWQHVPEDRQARIIQLWQAYKQQMAPPPMPGGGGGEPAPGAGAQPGAGGQPPIGAPEQDFPMPGAVEQMAGQAEGAMAPPPEFTDAGPPA